MTERVVVITGATGPAGRAAARAFAERGDALVLIGRELARLRELRRELPIPDDCVMLQEVDMTDLAAVKASAQAVEARFGGAHVLLHFVGGWTGGPSIAETDPADLEWMLRQHVWTSFNMIQAFAPQLKKAGWGRVVTISTPGVTNPAAGRGVYSAAKAAEETLFFTLGRELEADDVTANTIVVESIDAQGTGKGTSLKAITDWLLQLVRDDSGWIKGMRVPIN